MSSKICPKGDMRKSKEKAARFKHFFKVFINLNYISGFLYAFYFFISTPRQEQMLERRLWAYECWLILTGYGLFIYLFYLEKSALEGKRGLFRFMKIQAQELIHAPKRKLLSWFQKIADNPQLYQFDSHAGVEIKKGQLLQAGSIFTTKEKFLGIEIKLTFKVVSVEKEKGIEFALLRSPLPSLGIKGKFRYQMIDHNLIKLQLVIFNHPQTIKQRIVSALFYLSPLRLLVAHQIRKEVRFIAREVEL